jgi:hypothetical protein
MSEKSMALKELDDVLEDLVGLLKNPEVGAELANRGVNVSFAIVVAEAVAAFVEGNNERAAEDFSTIAEELNARIARSKADAPS